MGKNKKATHSRKEEQQGKRVLKIIAAVAVLLAVIMVLVSAYI